VKTKILLLLVALLVSIALQSHAMEKGIFQPPSLEDYEYERAWQMDINKDGVKETHVTMYKNSDGGKILKITSLNGTVWAWAVRSSYWPKDKEDLTKNYTLRDSNCDGVFDEKLKNDEAYKVPDCLRDRMKK